MMTTGFFAGAPMPIVTESKPFTPVAADLFRHGMRYLAAGVSIVTSLRGAGRAGLTATAVCSLTAEPPQLLACVNRGAEAHDAIAESRVLCVNLLAGRHRALAQRFAGEGDCQGPARFLAGEWTTMLTGAPALADSLASFDCRLVEAIPASTHTVFIAQVVAVSEPGPGPVLVYADGRYRDLPLDPAVL
jgi:flavin reductase (DIM6/NTAB) family NADH-FMN oxidoreductase RutF